MNQKLRDLTYKMDAYADPSLKLNNAFWREFRPVKNKALVPEVQKFAEIGFVDGVRSFTPNIIIKKTDC